MPTDQVIATFAHEWFDLLSAHAPIEQLLPFVTTEGLEMEFPERTLCSRADVADWYVAVGRSYTDQSHDVEAIAAAPSPIGTHLDVTVVWKAEQVADGTRIASRVRQSWEITDPAGEARPVIVKYRVLALQDL